MIEQTLLFFASHMSIIYDFIYEIAMLVLTLIPILKSKKSRVMKIRIPLKKIRDKAKIKRSLEK